MNSFTRSLVWDFPRAARDRLEARFASSTLAYHNFDHIAYMLDLHEQYFVDRLTSHENTMLRIAIWWHDEWYHVGERENERISSDRAQSVMGLSPSDNILLNRLIMATKHHVSMERLERIMIDLDLAILAAPSEQYARYARAIRKEYAIYEDSAYRVGRAEVLNKLVTRDSLAALNAAMGLPNCTLTERALTNLAWERSCLISDATTVELALE